MASFPHTLRHMTANPVARAELTHQRRSATAHHQWRRFPRLFGILVAISVITYLAQAIIPQVAGLLNIEISVWETVLSAAFDTVTILLAALLMIHHLLFAMAALQLAASSIAREKRGRTWESLLLTGVDARRIIYGKWGASMRMLWDAYRRVLLLRFAGTLWLSLAGGTTSMAVFPTTPAPLPEILLLGMITAIFPLCFAAFTVALGLVASLIVTSEMAAARVAALFYYSTLLLSLCLLFVTSAQLFSEVHPELYTLILSLFATPLDGGLLALIAMFAYSSSVSMYYLLGTVICILLYAVLTWGMLRFAQALTVRQRGLPPI